MKKRPHNPGVGDLSLFVSPILSLQVSVPNGPR